MGPTATAFFYPSARTSSERGRAASKQVDGYDSRSVVTKTPKAPLPQASAGDLPGYDHCSLT